MNDLPPPPVDYQALTRGGRSFVAGGFDWRTFARAALLVGLTIGILLVVVPRFEQSFAEQEVELPPATKALFALQRALADGWWLALLTIPPGLGFLVGQFGPVGRRLARVVIVVAFGALVMFVVLAVFQPLLSLVEGMSGAR